MFRLHWFAFPAPNPSHPALMWRANVLWGQWELFLILTLCICLTAYGLYYFWTLPSPFANRRFWILSTSLVVVGAVIAYALLRAVSDVLLTPNHPWNISMTLVTLVSGLGCSILIGCLVIGIFLCLSKLPGPTWQIKAMRRYPLKMNR